MLLDVGRNNDFSVLIPSAPGTMQVNFSHPRPAAKFVNSLVKVIQHSWFWLTVCICVSEAREKDGDSGGKKPVCCHMVLESHFPLSQSQFAAVYGVSSCCQTKGDCRDMRKQV